MKKQKAIIFCKSICPRASPGKHSYQKSWYLQQKEFITCIIVFLASLLWDYKSPAPGSQAPNIWLNAFEVCFDWIQKGIHLIPYLLAGQWLIAGATSSNVIFLSDNAPLRKPLERKLWQNQSKIIRFVSTLLYHHSSLYSSSYRFSQRTEKNNNELFPFV